MKISVKEKFFAAVSVAIIAAVLILRMFGLQDDKYVDLSGTVNVSVTKAAISEIEGIVKVKEYEEDENSDLKGYTEKELISTGSGIIIPAKSVIVRDERLVVVTLDNEKLPKYTEVEVGLKNNKYVQILKGLEEGDVYLTEGQQYVEEGKVVKVIEE